MVRSLNSLSGSNHIERGMISIGLLKLALYYSGISLHSASNLTYRDYLTKIRGRLAIFFWGGIMALKGPVGRGQALNGGDFKIIWGPRWRSPSSHPGQSALDRDSKCVYQSISRPIVMNYKQRIFITKI